MRRNGFRRRIALLGVAALAMAGAAIAANQGALACCGGCGLAKGGAPASGAAASGHGAGHGCCGAAAHGRAARGAGRGLHGAGTGPRRGAGMAHHENIQALLDRHDAIDRTVEEIDGGVVTVTTSEDPDVARTIRGHVAEMKERMQSGQVVRWWDPLFAELFLHHDKIDIQIEEIAGGVRVRETSEDPGVVKLIRQHALRGVSEFVAEGRPRARHPTPLPDGYQASGGKSGW